MRAEGEGCLVFPWFTCTSVAEHRPPGWGCSQTPLPLHHRYPRAAMRQHLDSRRLTISILSDREAFCAGGVQVELGRTTMRLSQGPSLSLSSHGRIPGSISTLGSQCRLLRLSATVLPSDISFTPSSLASRCRCPLPPLPRRSLLLPAAILYLANSHTSFRAFL